MIKSVELKLLFCWELITFFVIFTLSLFGSGKKATKLKLKRNQKNRKKHSEASTFWKKNLSYVHRLLENKHEEVAFRKHKQKMAKTNS